MSKQAINWGKWMSILTCAAIVAGAILWLAQKVMAYGPLPEQVKDHETRITRLETDNMLTAYVTSNNFAGLERQIRWMERRMNNDSTNGLP